MYLFNSLRKDKWFLILEFFNSIVQLSFVDEYFVFSFPRI